MSSALEESVASGTPRVPEHPTGCSLILLHVEVEELLAIGLLSGSFAGVVAAHVRGPMCFVPVGSFDFPCNPVCLAASCYHPFYVRNFGSAGSVWME